MLLAIAKRTSIGNHTNTKQIIASDTSKWKLTAVFLPASNQEFLTLSSNNFLRHRVEQCEYCCPFTALPVRLAIVPAICVLSPTRTNRGIFGVSINSLAVTTEASNIPVSISLVCE